MRGVSVTFILNLICVFCVVYFWVWFVGSLSRYIVRRYGTVMLRKEVKERLRRLAESEGVSMAELIERMIVIYERLKGDSRD